MFSEELKKTENLVEKVFHIMEHNNSEGYDKLKKDYDNLCKTYMMEIDRIHEIAELLRENDVYMYYVMDILVTHSNYKRLRSEIDECIQLEKRLKK